MCQDERRNSPSVMPWRPTSSCIFTMPRMASSSTSRSSSSVSRPALCSARARVKAGGRSRLPTWSARNGGWFNGISLPLCVQLLLEFVQRAVARQHLRHAGIRFALLADGGEELAVLQLDAVHRDVHL